MKTSCVGFSGCLDGAGHLAPAETPRNHSHRTRLSCSGALAGLTCQILARNGTTPPLKAAERPRLHLGTQISPPCHWLKSGPRHPLLSISAATPCRKGESVSCWRRHAAKLNADSLAGNRHGGPPTAVSQAKPKTLILLCSHLYCLQCSIFAITNAGDPSLPTRASPLTPDPPRKILLFPVLFPSRFLKHQAIRADQVVDPKRQRKESQR